MNAKEIEARVKRLGIDALNDMQRAVMASRAHKLVVLAPTGSGKTVAYAIALLRALPKVRAGEPQQRVMAVVIAPSRELVIQIYEVIRRLASPPYKVIAMYGGNSFAAEQRNIEGGVPAIVIATPGRLLDHLQRGTLRTDSVDSVTIDEYDKILELGFRDELRKILRRTVSASHLTLSSATEPDSLPEAFSGNDVETMDFRTDAKARVHLRVINVPSAARDKLDTLAALVQQPATGTCIVFVNHRESAERTVKSLEARGIGATLYHGGMEQLEREIAVAKFKSGVARVLVATDLAARGLDMDTPVDSVIHYHIPVNEAAYTHRNGRTARAGASGTVYVIIGPDEDTPDYIVTEHDYYPGVDNEEGDAHGSLLAMIYINAGKEMKISRGDVAGFLMKACNIPAAAIGVITIGRTYSLAAVEGQYIRSIVEAARQTKIKGHRVRISEC